MNTSFERTITTALNTYSGNDLQVAKVQFIRFNTLDKYVLLLVYAFDKNDVDKKYEFYARLTEDGYVSNVSLHRTNWFDIELDKKKRNQAIQLLMLPYVMAAEIGGTTYANT